MCFQSNDSCEIVIENGLRFMKSERLQLLFRSLKVVSKEFAVFISTKLSLFVPIFFAFSYLSENIAVLRASPSQLIILKRWLRIFQFNLQVRLMELQWMNVQLF